MNCTHQRTHESYENQNYFGDEVEGYWVRETVSTTVDLDTHRYKCTQCSKIMYYSGAAADFYEKGIRRGIFD